MSDRTPVEIHPIRTKHHRADGQLYAQLARRRESGEITRLRTGVFLPSAEWRGLGPVNRHRLLVTETFPLLRSDAVAAFWSAAAMLGIPLLGSPPDRVHVTDVRKGGQSSTHVRHHRERRRPPSVVVEGVACTTPARTVVDLARVQTFEAALIAVDHVLSRGMASHEEVVTEMEALGRAHGSWRTRLVVAHASDRSESPGESLSRARMIQLGAPLPELQHEFRDDRGLIGRSDYWWETPGLVGEFDGAGKYGVGKGAMEVSANEVVYREKLREDRIRALGWTFLRWGWDDAISLPRFTRILAAAGLIESSSTPLPQYMYRERD